MKDEVKTRLIYENNEDRFIWESPYSDVSMEDILDAFYGILIGSTWQPITILQAMKDFLEEHHMYEDNDEYDEDPRPEDLKPQPHYYA